MVKRAGWVQVAFQVPEDYAEKLKELSEDSYTPQSQLLREALRLLFEKHGVEVRTRKAKR
jgi:Arc/MetJ-type ribon-helix-helix transcriptional regulator